jgi:hypothetical protein
MIMGVPFESWALAKNTTLGALVRRQTVFRAEQGLECARSLMDYLDGTKAPCHDAVSYFTVSGFSVHGKSVCSKDILSLCKILQNTDIRCICLTSRSGSNCLRSGGQKSLNLSIDSIWIELTLTISFLFFSSKQICKINCFKMDILRKILVTSCSFSSNSI